MTTPPEHTMMTPTMSARREKTRGIDKLPARKSDASDSMTTATQSKAIRAMTDPVRTLRKVVKANMDEDSLWCRVVPARAFTVKFVRPAWFIQQSSTKKHRCLRLVILSDGNQLMRQPRRTARS